MCQGKEGQRCSNYREDRETKGSRFRCAFLGVVEYVERMVTLWWIPSQGFYFHVFKILKARCFASLCSGSWKCGPVWAIG